MKYLKVLLTILITFGIMMYIGCSSETGDSTTTSTTVNDSSDGSDSDSSGDAAEAGKIICYSDGTYSPAIVSGKTPVGIAITVDESGKPTKMMHLRQSSSVLALWTTNPQDYMLLWDENDGSSNCQKLYDSVIDISDSEKYPAFAYVKLLGNGWYIPAKNELNVLYQLKDVINGTLSALQKAGVSVSLLDSPRYLSSTVASEAYAWAQNFSIGTQFAIQFYVNDRQGCYVRAIRSF